MPICAQCGEDNPARARFCLACGSPLAASGTGREVRKTVTVVFSDLVGSTPLGERLDPESLREVITRYYDRAAEVLLWLGWHFGLAVHHFNYESQDEDKTRSRTSGRSRAPQSSTRR